MNKTRVAVAVLLPFIAPLIAGAVPIGDFPALDKIIDAADAFAYQAQKHEKRQESLKSILPEREAAEPPAEPDDEQPENQIGEVLGKPVYRDEIRTGEDIRLSTEFHRLFAHPVMEEYKREHKDDITPTESEIAAATACFDKEHQQRLEGQELQLRWQLKAAERKLAAGGVTEEVEKNLNTQRRSLQSRLTPPGRSFAASMLNNWNFQRYLYDGYGGGRILWQQAGLEAFDAMHQWLTSLEKDGKFKITDPELRSVFYEYWTTMKHGTLCRSAELTHFCSPKASRAGSEKCSEEEKGTSLISANPATTNQ